MRRRLLIIFATLLAVLVVSVAALPLWLGAALKGAGVSRGLKFSRYERIGYARFALHDVEVRQKNVLVTVSRIEADTPLLAWSRKGEIVGGRWLVDVQARTEAAPVAKTESGWVPLRVLLHKIAAQLDRWAPRVRAEAGVVRWPGSELTCATATWAGRELKVGALAWRELQADASLTFAGDAMRLLVNGAEGNVTAQGNGSTVTAAGVLWDQKASLVAQFSERGWLPREAKVQADDWNLPGARLKLGETYATVRGRGFVEWREQKFSAEMAATGEPLKGQTVPPLEVALRGQGDAQSFTVESLNAALPGIVARLSEPVTVERSGKLRESAARFTVEVDLAKQPWFEAKGAVTGEARLVSNLGQAPMVGFRLTARDVSAADWGASLVEAKGQLDWPRLQVSEGTLTGTAGEKLVWSGGWDFSTKEILEAVAEGQIRRATVARWVPVGWAFDAVTLKAEANGVLAEVKHSGRAEAAKVKFRELNPLDVTLAWSGQGAAVDTLTTVVKAGPSTLTAEGAVSRESVRLSKLELTQGGETRLALREPAAVRWRPAVQVEALHLTGPEGAVDAAVTWGEAGRVDVTARNFSSAWLRDFGVLSGPEWRVTSLEAKGAWERGPMVFALKGTGAIELGEGRSAIVRTMMQGDKQGVRIEELSVMEAERSVVKATGRLPLRLSPGAAKLAEFEAEGALALDATTEPNAGFWEQLASLTGFELKEPEAVAQVKGTWARPQGTVRLKAARVSPNAKFLKRPLPALEALEIELAGDAGEVRLERLTVTVEGQVVRARGRLPVAEGKWREFLQGPLAWAQRGVEAQLEVPEAEVAALARFLPVFVAPKGRIQVDVTFKQGVLGGALHLRDAATRPLGPLGVLQEVNAELVFSGRKMELRSVTAQSGGQTVTLSGSVELPEVTAKPGAKPAGEPAIGVNDLKFDVALKGANLPFVRQTGVLVRGDLDLKLTTPAQGPPRIIGAVQLRESLFLSDVRALLPGRARTKSRTPPYFAVEVAPYDAWQLDVSLQGEKFLKLRTALFNGVASARFQLSGTLGEPLLRGEATIDEGSVRLPFATFAVQEGRVSLTPEQGVEPQVSFVGTVRRLNYDLRMEASGAASAPTLVFSSSPPLESGQVLLMVMAGQSPHDEVSYSDRQRVTRLGAFLGQSLVASLGGESEAGERLSLSTGENVSRQGRETYDIEYRLSERWSMLVEYDEFDDVNAGLKWRVYSRGGQRGQAKEEKKK